MSRRSGAPAALPPCPTTRSTDPRGRLPRLGLVLLTTLFACDVQGIGGSDGCLSVHQGDYTFPVKRVIEGATSTRVTAAGTTLVTDHIHTLLSAFFDTDDTGQALVPLDTLGMGTISTALGPFEAELRDVVLTLDLASMTVTLVEESSPPEIRLSVVDADVGMLTGTVGGAVDLGITEPDLACALSNGPNDRVARLSFDIVMTLATDADGRMDVSADVLSVDIQDVAVDVDVDCSLGECQDGCGECQLLCTAASVAAQVTTAAQALLDELVDDLATWLADQLAAPVLDQLVNDKPLAIEGTLALAPLLKHVLPAMHGVRPLGVLMRPTGEAFVVTGSGANTALETTVDAGVDAAASHPCVGVLGAEPTFDARPLPPWPETLPDGGTYHAGMALSEALADQAFYAAWKAGALCIDATTRDVATLTAGEVVLRAATLELMLPGISAFAGDEASIQLSIRPAAGAPPTLTFMDEAAPIRLTLVGVEMSLAVFIGDGYQRILSITSDFGVSIALDPLEGGRVGARLDALSVENPVATFTGPFEAARIDLIVPLVTDLLTGALADASFDLDLDPTRAITALTGVPLSPELQALSAGGGWLQMLMTATPVAVPPSPMVAAHVTPSIPGSLSVHTAGPPGSQMQLRIRGGGWTPWMAVGGTHEVSHPRLWLTGSARVAARFRASERSPAGDPVEIGSVTVAAPSPSTALTPAPVAAGGCASGGGGPDPTPLLVLLGAWLVTRRRMGVRLSVWFVLLGGLVGCADDPPSSKIPCEDHPSCQATYLCIDGFCEPATPCDDDDACCPGAECFSGWCRPTSECETSDACIGLDEVCEDGVCVPKPCTSDLACAMGRRCIAGRCLTDAPCGAACDEDQVCHAATGRCVSAECEERCEDGTVAVVVGGVDALTCDVPACECTASAPAPSPSPGQEAQLGNLGGTLMMASYDPVYGDLVWSLFEPDEERVDLALAGVPDVEATSDQTDYRGGVSAPGPDVGRRPTWVAVSSDDGVRAAMWYQDVDAGGLTYRRTVPWSGEAERSYPLPLEGRAGRFSCLTTDGATGALVGWIYVAANATGERSRLLRLNATSPDPVGLEDWTVTVLSERMLPLTASEPCGGECETLEHCLRSSSGEQCVSVFEQASCEEPCEAHHVCARDPVGDTSACWPRVVPEAALSELPSGTGLFLTCGATPEGAVAAWYDADAGALFVVRGPGGDGEPVRLDGTLEPLDGSDVGRHAALTTTPDGGVTVFYQDVLEGRVVAATQALDDAPWSTEVVHDGLVSTGLHLLGTGISASRLGDGREVVAYGDGTTGDVWLSARGQGACWHHVLAWSDGTWVWPSIAAMGGGEVGITAVELRLDATLAVRRDLQRLVISAPNGDCSPP